MSFPLIPPKIQFFDNSGNPLSTGSIEFRSPSTNLYIPSYPTADDADAEANANSNPLILNSRGEAPVGIFLSDNVSYKVILKDSSGDTIWTIDDVKTPSGLAALLASTYTPGSTNSVDRTLQSRLDDVVSVKDFGALGDGSTDDTAAVLLAIAGTVGSGFHRTLYWPSGRYKITSAITIDADTDSTSSTDHRNLRWIGEGGMGTESGTEIRFDVNSASVDGLVISSSFGVDMQNIAFTSNTAIRAVVRVEADASPAFSSAMVNFTNCYFNAFLAAPTVSVIFVNNSKLVSFHRCWMGAKKDATAILIGADVGDSGSFLAQGAVDNIEIRQCYIFGVVNLKNIRTFEIVNNTFVEDFGSRIGVTGEELLHGGIIDGNFFAGTAADVDDRVGITVGDYEIAGGEQAGCISIRNNRFRYRDLGIQVNSKTPVVIEGNHFRGRTAAAKGIQIAATAERVYIGQNDFDDLRVLEGAIGIQDLRQAYNVDQPTDGVSTDIVADFVLSADDTAISGTNTTALVGSVSSVHLRGGMYRLRMHVVVANTAVSDSLPFQAWLAYRDEDNNLTYLGVAGSGAVLPTADFASGFARASVDVERIVHLPATSKNTPTTSAFELYVKNVGNTTPATGNVEGGADELSNQMLTWFQVEEYTG